MGRSSARKARLGLSALLGLAIWALGCAAPAKRFDATARDLGFTREVVRGTRFDHIVYHRRRKPSEGTLHIYLAGDADPRRATRWFPPDPTPGGLPLFLMASDPGPSLLLGRPCAHDATRCDEVAPWTSARYGEAVVESLGAAIDSLEPATGDRGVVLIGYSGGGTLAMLVAERLAQVRRVVTLAGNLDTAAWVGHHGFPGLPDSLNPAERPPLSVPQLHLVGENDKVVPPHLGRTLWERQPNAEVRRLPGVDHTCCWERVWPAVARELRETPAR